MMNDERLTINERMNTIGRHYRLTSFGESHGAALGGVVDGCPAGEELSLEGIQKELDRRRPGQSAWGSTRQEADRVELLSGLLEGKTTGMPIGFVVRNGDLCGKENPVPFVQRACLRPLTS